MSAILIFGSIISLGIGYQLITFSKISNKTRELRNNRVIIEKLETNILNK